MANIRKKYSAEEKTRMVLESLKGSLTQSQLTAKYDAHGTQINNWKKKAISGIADTFSKHKERHNHDQQELIDELYRQIGQLKVELDWLKKNLNFSAEIRRSLIDDVIFLTPIKVHNLHQTNL